MTVCVMFNLLIVFILLILVRLCYLLYKIHSGKTKYSFKKREHPLKTLICIGSGGHTAEMLRIVKNLSVDNYSPRLYVMASSDSTSKDKVMSMENLLNDNDNYNILIIPRSRVVNQSYFTSVFTTLYSIIYCIPLLLKTKPNLILCNGPGTCIPICLVAFAMKLFFIHTDNRIVFIESICRVQNLSFSGKILLYFADNFIVQWETLNDKVKRSDCFGRIC